MKIEIKDNSGKDDVKHLEFPPEYEYFGKDEQGDLLKIFVSEDALKRIDEYLSSDKNNELGGVLIGEVFINSVEKRFILIDNLIIAKHSNSSISRLTFTHETWDYINKILDKDFPDKKILGWFHSHPGHTVFLSNYDIFIQENFFNMEYMVAYVYDPTINERGFFYWKNGKTVKSDGYYVFDMKKKNDDIELLTLNSNADLLNVDEKGNSDYTISNKNYKNYITIGLLFLTLLLLLFIIYNIYDFKQKALLKEVYLKDLSDLKNENKKLTERLNEYILESELKKNSSKINNPPVLENKDYNNSENKVTETDSKVVKNNAADTKETENNIRDNANTVNNDQAKDISGNVTKYKVKSGDTLEKISYQYYKGRAGIDVIMKHNNIKNKADIKIGQELELPDVSQ